MKEDFYDIAFRKKVYSSLDALQCDVNEWLKKYNEYRPHSGKYGYGKTPMQNFLDPKHLAKDKKLDKLYEEQQLAPPPKYVNEMNHFRAKGLMPENAEFLSDRQVSER